MEIVNISIAIFAMFVAIIVLDYIWLGIITKNFIISQFGSLIDVENGSIKIKLGVGILTWFIIAVGTFIFAVNPSETIGKAMLLGAVFGFVLYSVYDLTNLTFISNYPVKFIFVDIAWGTFLCTTISAIGFFIRGLI